MEKGWCFQANVDRWIGDDDKKTGIDWKWQAMDGVITKAPLGGKKHRTKSHRQSQSGTKRSILVDGKGLPLGVCVDGANRHDMKSDQSNTTKHSHL